MRVLSIAQTPAVYYLYTCAPWQIKQETEARTLAVAMPADVVVVVGQLRRNKCAGHLPSIGIGN